MNSKVAQTQSHDLAKHGADAIRVGRWCADADIRRNVIGRVQFSLELRMLRLAQETRGQIS